MAEGGEPLSLPYSKMQVQYQNQEATMPLVVEIDNYCNTPDDHLYANIRENSRAYRHWLDSAPAHDMVAVICGSGPSLADDLDEVRRWVRRVPLDRMASVFALNGASKYLTRNGASVDYQVILDAREQSAQLVDQMARTHLLCSQCHPATFARAHEPILWHLAYEKLEECLQDEDEIGKVWNTPGPFVQIGGRGISCGNAAVVLAYAMGYRTIHVYGFDSSAREGQTHAFRQPMNDGEPMARVKFNGKEYLTSFTMKLQAEHFQATAHALEKEGCKVHVHGTGLLPDIWNAPPLEEREKYRQVWEEPAYRNHSPGEEHAAEFVQMAEVQQYHHVLDLGCGTGRGGSRIRALAGCPVTLVDFARNCLDRDLRHDLAFVEADLSKPIPASGDYGFCCDVLEHIPPSQVEAVIRNCLAAAPTVYFNISTLPDQLGQLISRPLHLSIHPFAWWRDEFKRLGYAIRFAEERPGEAVFLISVP